jgi:hypothetical protein
MEPTGFAKLEYRPGEEFIGLFVRTCTAMQLEGFNPQALASIINGESYGLRPVNDETWKSVLCDAFMAGTFRQALRSWSIRQARSSWGCS